MEMPPKQRWLQAVVPAFIGIKKDSYAGLLSKLSKDPSIETNTAAAKFLAKMGYVVTLSMLFRSVQDNVRMILNHIESSNNLVEITR